MLQTDMEEMTFTDQLMGIGACTSILFCFWFIVAGAVAIVGDIAFKSWTGDSEAFAKGASVGAALASCVAFWFFFHPNLGSVITFGTIAALLAIVALIAWKYG